jgi:DNA-binding transcriptional regulator WhiA
MASGNRTRIYNFAQDKFDIIDSNDKAYWLGFLLGDGSVTPYGSLSIELSNKDRDHLYKFRNFMQATYPILETRKNCSKISLNCVAFTKKLFQYGLIPNKTRSTKTPNIESKYLSSFYRGIFDSDGWVTFSPKTASHCPQYSVGFSSANKLFLQEIQNWFILHGTTRGALTHRKYKTVTGECWQFIINGRKNMKIIYNLLYNDSNHEIYLSRKFLIFQELLKDYS